eukprot:scaffold2512_cov164-Amphora_coffeaeformis.AAC.15
MTTTPDNDLSRKAVVDGRWKLLRDALRGKPVNRQAAFVGYDMIASRRLQQDEELTKGLRQNLLILNSIPSSTSEGTMEDFRTKLVDALETSLLGLLSLDTEMQDSKGSQSTGYEFSIPNYPELNVKADDMAFISVEICRRCEFETCRVVEGEDSCSLEKQPRNKLRVEITTSHKNRFLIRQYQWQQTINDASNHDVLLVREKSPEQ